LATCHVGRAPKISALFLTMEPWDSPLEGCPRKRRKCGVYSKLQFPASQVIYTNNIDFHEVVRENRNRIRQKSQILEAEVERPIFLHTHGRGVGWGFRVRFLLMSAMKHVSIAQTSSQLCILQDLPSRAPAKLLCCLLAVPPLKNAC
jgi:hypothetical protein